MATKLLLIKDVEDLGRSGDVVSVKPGYARNRLIPMGSAVFADKNALRRQTRLQEERLKKAAEDKKVSEGIAGKVEAQTVSVTVKVDHDGHMYGSVSIVDIVHLLEQQLGIAIEKRAVQLKHPIKQVGTHNVIIKLPEGVVAAFHVKVVAEGAEEAAPAAATE
ncbi:MAG: 50S ribosomal protein L9 [Parachlamydiaceae bacterium]